MFIFPNYGNINKEISKLDLVSKNYLLYSVNSDQVIAYKNHKDKLPVASIIKVLTTLTVLEMLDENTTLDTEFEVSPLIFDYLDPNASITKIYSGQKLTIKEALYGVMLSSGADSILALSLFLTDDPDGLNQPMQDLADRIGMKNTVIKNPTGLDEKGHVSTLEDVLTLMLYSRDNDDFMDIYTKKEYTFINGPDFTIHNHMLKIAEGIGYPQLYGAKSGFTYQAENALSSFAKQDDMEYIFISTEAGYTWDTETNESLNDAIKVYSYMFDTYLPKIVPPELSGAVQVPVRGRYSYYQYKNNDTFELLLQDDFNPEALRFEYKFNKDIKAPVEKNSVIGTQLVYYNDELIFEHEMRNPETISRGIFYPSLVVAGCALVLSPIISFLKKKVQSQQKKTTV